MLLICRGQINVCKSGMGVPFSEEKAKDILGESEITILIELNSGGVRHGMGMRPYI